MSVEKISALDVLRAIGTIDRSQRVNTRFNGKVLTVSLSAMIEPEDWIYSEVIKRDISNALDETGISRYGDTLAEVAAITILAAYRAECDEQGWRKVLLLQARQRKQMEYTATCPTCGIPAHEADTKCQRGGCPLGSDL